MKHSLFSPSSKDPSQISLGSLILPILFYLVAGILLILFRSLALRVAAYVGAAVLVGFGVVYLFRYLRSEIVHRIIGGDLAVALILIFIGILLALNPDAPSNLLPAIWGLALLFGCFLKIQYALDEKALKIKRWWIMLIFAAVSLVIGILALLRPDFFGENMEIIVGIMLIAEAVLDVVVFFLLRSALKKNAPAAQVHMPVEEPPAELPAAAAVPAEPAPAAAPAPAADTEEGGTPDAQ